MDELKLIDLWIQAEAARWRADGLSEQPADLRGLPYISQAEADRILRASLLGLRGGGGRPDIASFFSTYLNLRERVDARIRATPANTLRLPYLQNALGLTNAEVILMLLVLAPEWDPRFRRLYAYLQDDATRALPTVGLLARIAFGNPALASQMTREETAQALLSGYSALAPHTVLRRTGLLLLVHDERTSFAEQEMRLSPRLVDFLAASGPVGEPEPLDPALESFADVERPETAWDQLILPDGLLDQLPRVPQALQAAADAPRGLLTFVGPANSGQRDAARAITAEMGLNLLIVDAGRAFQALTADTLETMLYREAILQHAAIFVHNVVAAQESQDMASAVHSTLVRLAPLLPGPAFMETEGVFPSRARHEGPDYLFHFVLPAYHLRRRLWARALASVDVQVPTDPAPATDEGVLPPEVAALPAPLRPLVRELANQFVITGSQIQHAVGLALDRARLVGSPPRPTRQDLWEAAQRLAAERLIHFAQKLTPRHTWDQLVLPPASKRHLLELADRIRYRSRVYAEAGFQSRVSLGRGLLVLFTGPSGTGKTMAAEVIASAHGMDLYKIDLSAIVSKFIGETEKNLSRIFQDAEASNAILFFDEADALFGKRSEVKDAHDRYANIEINYLLQRIEEYDGVVILASNLRQNMDEAFLRRLNVIVEFPFPSAAARAAIWRGMFPTGVVLEPDVDLDGFSARFRLSGGSIRNAAVDAAFRAAAVDGVPGQPLRIQREHLILAIGREYQKLGRPITRGEFGPSDYVRLSDYLYDGQEAQ